MSAEECLKDAYVKFMYIPPSKLEVAADCTKVKFLSDPEIMQTDPYELVEWPHYKRLAPSLSSDISILCVELSLSGAGKVFIVVQVSRFIKIPIGFKNRIGKDIVENHYVFVSIPTLIPIPGPRIALMAVTPWKLKLIPYTGMIVNIFRNLEEVERIMGKILQFKKNGFCAKDIDNFRKGLSDLEAELNSLLRRAAESETGIAVKMEHRGIGKGLFAGSAVG